MASCFLSSLGSVPAPHFHLGLLFSSPFGFYLQKLLNMGLFSFGGSRLELMASGSRKKQTPFQDHLFPGRPTSLSRKSLEGLGVILSGLSDASLAVSRRSHRCCLWAPCLVSVVEELQILSITDTVYTGHPCPLSQPRAALEILPGYRAVK